MKTYIHPCPSGGVQRYTYVVQPGDTPELISHKLTGRDDLWPGLVGANQHHKPIVDHPKARYATFENLSPGEHLFVPAKWGQLGEPAYDQLAGVLGATLGAMAPGLQTQIQSQLPGWQMPNGPNGVPYSPQNVGNVIVGWLPYLSRMPNPPPTQTSWPTDLTQWDFGTLANAYRSASDLLRQAQVPQANTTVFRSIPWDAVPWQSFPWHVINGAVPPQMLPQVWSFFVNSMNMPNVMRPMTWSAKNHTPNFFETDWTSGNVSNVPWEAIAWETIDPDLFTDTRVHACFVQDEAAARARLAQMMDHKECFVGQGPAKFAAYLCKQPDGTYRDLEACSAGPVPPTGACLPPMEYNPTTGACEAPVPQQGVCREGEFWDTATGRCIRYQCPPGQYLDPATGQCVSYTLPPAVVGPTQLPPGTTPTPGVVPTGVEEAKPDNTGLYVALGAGALVLVGLFAAAKMKK